jgi:hypothetical protein
MQKRDATFDSKGYSYADVPSPYWFDYLWREELSELLTGEPWFSNRCAFDGWEGAT